MAKPSLNGLPNTFGRPVFPLATSSARILVGACPLNPNLTPSMLRAQVPERRRINGGYLPLLRVAQWRVSWAKTGAPNLLASLFAAVRRCLESAPTVRGLREE